jgi:hypothetical protein
MNTSSADKFKAGIDKAFSDPKIELNQDTQLDAMKFKQGFNEDFDDEIKDKKLSKKSAKDQFRSDLQNDPDFIEFKKRAKHGENQTLTFGTPNASIDDPYVGKKKYSRVGKSETKEATGSGSSGAYSSPVFGGNDEFWQRSRAEMKENNSLNKNKDLNESCWKGYKQVGGKMKNGKMVPNCVPVNKSVKEASNPSQQAAIAIHMKEKGIKPKNEVYGEIDESENKPTNPKLWAASLAWARSRYDVCPSAYCNGAAAKHYKSKGGKWKKKTKNESTISEDILDEDLRRWFKEKWVDVSKKVDGKHPPCGRKDADGKAYPKCRPSKKVSKETPKLSSSFSKDEKEKMTQQKRREEKKEPKIGKGNKPTMTHFKGTVKETIEKVEAKEATGSGSVGGYETPAMWAKSTKKKDWGPSRKPQIPGGGFVKVKKKCTKFPYCNQGDINALKISKNEAVESAIKEVAKKMNIGENVIRTILEHEYEKLNKRSK